jgi:nicotinamidase-related amidase
MAHAISGLREELIARTVHICVDMQRLFAPGGPWATPWMDRVLPVIVEIVERNPDRTVFTRFIPPAKPEDCRGAWRRYYERWRHVTRQNLDPRLLDLVPPLDRFAPPAQIVDKPVYSPFFGTALPSLLRKSETDTVVVTGAETDVCVLATVLGAVDHGYRVVVVSDAVCSSSDAGHDAMMTLYRERFSEQIAVATAEDVLAAWPAGKGRFASADREEAVRL